MSKNILDELQKAIKSRHINMATLAKKLSIPRDRMYKWYQQGTEPKAEDAVKVWNWINGFNDISEVNEDQAFYGILEEIKANPGKKAEDFVFSYEELVQMNRNNIAIIKDLREKLQALEKSEEKKTANTQKQTA